MSDLPISQITFPRRAVFSNTYFRTVYLDLNAMYGINSLQFQIENIDVINGKILNVIATAPGEIPFEPQFGSGIMQLLFGPTNQTTAWQALNRAQAAFQRWIPEIQLDRSNSFVGIDSQNGAFYFQFVYSAVGLTGPAVAAINMSR